MIKKKKPTTQQNKVDEGLDEQGRKHSSSASKETSVFLMIKRETTAQKPVHRATLLPAHWPLWQEKVSRCAHEYPKPSKDNYVFKRRMFAGPYHRCRNAFHFLPQSQFQVSWNKKGGHSSPNTMSEFHHISSFTLQSHYFLFRRHNKRGADLIIP